ncbi:LT_GEWL domain containing protein [uncultured Caudovirales phage]|uniref:LT_GEWL domain containing protein n=1 Tax=uncultured Caudovirales phage TaxID=2100421 RepID=A0A6J5MD22_9CAUD|nr:LT_GEWL domain containing protein [uncultured Caudovirales phage]
MAKAPDFQQIMQEYNVRPFVADPIVNRGPGLKAQANLGAIADVGGALISGAVAYDRAKTLEGVNQQVNDIVNEQQQRSLDGVAAQEKDIQNTQAQMDTVKKMAGYDNTYPIMLNQQLNTEVTGIQNVLTDKADRLVKAKNQGIMTEFELRERLAKVTREALAANPAYAREIARHVGTIAEVNNLSARVNQDVEIVKNQQASVASQIKQIETEALKNDINIWSPKFQNPDGTKDYTKIAEATGESIEKKQVYNAIDQSVKTNQAITNLNAQKVSDSGLHYKLTDAITDNTNAQFTKILQDGSIRDKEMAFTQVFNESMTMARRGFVVNNINPDDPRIKPALDLMDSQLKLIKETYSKQANGTYTAEEAKNRLDTLVNTKKYEVYTKMPSAIELEITANVFGKMSTRSQAQFQVEFDNKVKSLLDTPKEVMGTAYDKSDPSFASKAGGKDNVAKTFLDENINLTATEKRGGAELENTLSKFVAKLDTNPATGKQITQDLIRSLSNPQFKQVAAEIKDPALLSGLQRHISDYVPLLNNAVNQFRITNPGNLNVTFNDKDGTIVVTGTDQDPRSVNQFNAQTVRSINETFTAFYNTSGLSLSEARVQFYGKLPSLVPTGTLDKKTSESTVKGASVDLVIPRLAQIESGNRHTDDQGRLIKSPTGALGKYQILPSTAKDPGFDIKPITDLAKAPEAEHKRFATEYLSAMLKEFGGDMEKALAAYNAGPAVVRNAIDIDPINWKRHITAEAKTYINKFASL